MTDNPRYNNDPADEADKLVTQLGGPMSARSAALRFKQAAQTNKARAFWSAVIAELDK